MITVSSSVSAPVEPIETPPTLPQYESTEKYQYSVYLPTYRETLEPGGYAVVLDVSTEEKKQALYGYISDSIYELLKFDEEHGEEYRNDHDRDKMLCTHFRSKTEDGGHMASFATNYNFDEVLEAWSVDEIYTGVVINYNNATKINNNYMFSEFSDSFPNTLDLFSYPHLKETYGGKTSDEIRAMITEPMDRYLLDIKSAEDGKKWTNLRYETMSTLTQFTVETGKACIVTPEFFKVIRDDELYGWKTLTVPESGDYLLVTGSDNYPTDKPYAYSFTPADLEKLNAASYSTAQFNYDWAEGTSRIFFPTTAHAHKNTTYNTRFYTGRIWVSELVYAQNFDEPQENTGLEHIYYDLAAFNAASGTEMIVPQLSRLLPIEDKYYLYELGMSDRYTITNNGDHEVVVIGNLTSEIDPELDENKIAAVNYRYNDGRMGQFFNYEPLLPGESLEIYSSTMFAGDRGAATLTMPECCTVVDSIGNEYSHAGIEIDLLTGKTKED